MMQERNTLAPALTFSNGKMAALPGLGMTFYFTHPGKPEIRQALIRALSHYLNHARAHLSKFALSDFRRYKDINALTPEVLESFLLTKRIVEVELAQEDEQTATHWGAITFAEAVDNEHRQGYLWLAYPPELLASLGVEKFVEQFTSLCEQLQVSQAYAGYEFTFPASVGARDAACKRLGQLAMDFPGLDVSDLNTTALWFKKGIKSINFLTAVRNQLLADKGLTAQQVVDTAGYPVKGYPAGQATVFQAGEQPLTGANGESLTPYKALAKALEPVRADFKKTILEDPEGQDNKAFSKRWLTRFD